MDTLAVVVRLVQLPLVLYLPMYVALANAPDPEVSGAWLPAALAVASTLGGLFSKKAEGAAQGRVDEAKINQGRDALANQQYGIGQNAQMQLGDLDIRRKEFSEDARGRRGRQMALADLMMNFKPTEINVPGIQTAKVSGGLQGGLSDAGRAGMGEMYRQALVAMLKGDKFDGGQILKAPQLSQLRRPSGWERAAGIAGTIGNIAGAAAPFVGAPSPQASVPSIGATSGLPGGVDIGQGVGVPDLSDYWLPRNTSDRPYQGIRF